MITTTHTGYICKTCDQPAPIGVGYPVHTQQAQEASESVSVCQCGQSVGIFVFDGDYGNREQVRPYIDSYKTVRAALDAAHQYPYNDLFKGRIAGIQGGSEDTAIYMLQTMYQRDLDMQRVAEFSGTPVSELDAEWAPGEMRRGTVMRYGWYMGGTGVEVIENVRVTRFRSKEYLVVRKGKRNGRFMGAEQLMFKAA